MKCKKIFAMLLALCMVLTTFVAVSAEDVVVVDINEDYEDGIGDTICGGDISLATTGMETRNVLKVTSSYSGAAGWQSIVGFAVKDVEGTQFIQSEWPTEGTVEYSFDIFVPEEGGNTGDFTVYLRTGGSFPPAGNMDEFDPVNGLVKGEWNTYSGTFDASDIVWSTNATDDNLIWLCVRPNFSAAGTFYMDNVSFTLTQTVEDEPPVEPEEPAGDAFTTQSASTSIVDNGNDSYTAEMSTISTLNEVAVNDTTCWVRIIPETSLSLDDEWTITIDATASGLQDPDGVTSTKLRLFDNTSGTTMANTLGWVTAANASTADGTITMVFTSDAYSQAGNSTADEIQSLCLCYNFAQMYGATTGSVTFDNFTFEYGLPESEEPPVDPDEPPVDPDEPPVEPDEPDEPEEPGEVTYYNVVEIEAPLDDASEITMVGSSVTVENAEGEIGGRTGVVKATGVGNSNAGIVGLVIGNDFAFKPGDTISYSVDVYLTSNATPNLWLRRHTGDMEPFNSNFKPALGAVTAGEWVTITHECAFENLGNYDVTKAPQGWATPGQYALYLRADLGTVYIDNFSITVEREFVPTIESVELVEVGADNATFRVTADGAIDIDSLADYVTIDGVEVNPENVSVEAEDELNTLVTVVGLAPNTNYEVAVTGANSTTGRDVTIASEADCTVAVATIAEVEAAADLSNDTFTYTLTSNLADTETIYVVLLRCKGNTVIETAVATPVEAESGTPVSDSIEVSDLGDDEYYRFFAWTYEDGAINSMANLIDLD